MEEGPLRHNKIRRHGEADANAKVLAVVDERVVHLWDARSRVGTRDLALAEASANKETFRVHAKPIWSPSGRYLIAFLDDNRNSVAVWDVINGKAHSTLRGHHEPIGKIVWDPGEQYLFTFADMMHRMWDLESGALIGEFTSITPLIECDDTILGIAGDDYDKYTFSLFRTKRRTPVPLPSPSPGHGILKKPPESTPRALNP
jgi:WD40 repeat protein